MRTFLHLLRTDARRLLKTPSVALLWLAFPIGLSLIEYGAFGQMGRTTGLPKGELLIADDDGSLLSGFLAQSLQREPLSDFFTIVMLDSNAVVEKKLADNEGSAALRIPAGFQDSVLAGAPVGLAYTPNPRQSIRPQMISASLGMFLEVGNRFLHESRDAVAELRAANLDEGPPSRATVLSIAGSFFDAGQRFEKLGAVGDLDLKVERPAPKPENPAKPGNVLNFFAYFLPGLLLFSLLMVGQGFERRYFDLRTRGLHRRVAAAPVSPLTVLLSQGAAVLVAALMIGTVILVVGVLLFHIQPRQPLAIAVTLFGFGLFTVGLFKVLFGAARSKRAAETLGSIATLMMTLIGGGFAPLEIYNESVRPLAAATPVGCASTTLVNAIVHGRSLAESAPYSWATWAWAAAACIAGFALAWRVHART